MVVFFELKESKMVPMHNPLSFSFIQVERFSEWIA